MDQLRTASAWLEKTRTAYGSSPVSYLVAAEGTTLPVSATKGRSVFEVDDGNGFTLRTETVDWLILAADLNLSPSGWEPTVPAVGDQITDSSDGVDRLYEVLAPPGEPAWRWSDPYHQTYRIHTKYIGTPAPSAPTP